MKQTFTIPGRLPGLNEIIAANRSNRYLGAKQKRETQHLVAAYAMSLRATSHPVTVAIEWYEPTRRRDTDNITAGAKFILDALVEIGKLPNDSQAYVTGITHTVHVDKADPRIVVTLEEAS